MVLMLLCAAISCNKTELQNVEPKQTTGQYKTDPQLPYTNNRGNLLLPQLEMTTVYFDWHIYTIQYKKLTDEPVFINQPFKHEPADLYVYDLLPQSGTVTPKTFIPVTGMLDDPGTTMLWSEKKIRFNAGFKPQQFYSRDEVLLASIGIHPSISLISTGTVYEGTLFDAAKQPIVKPDRAL